MSTTEAAASPGSSKASPLDNMADWVAGKGDKLRATDAEEEPVAQPEPPAEPPAAAEPAAAPEPTPVGWRDVPIGDDVDHGFFKGKKTGDLYESYRNVEDAMRRKAEEAKFAQRENELLRQQLAQLQQSPAKPEREEAPKPAVVDPELEEINRLIFEEGATGLAKLKEKIRKDTKAEWEEDQRRIWKEEHERQSKEDGWTNLQAATVRTNESVRQSVMSDYGWDDNTAFMRLQSTWPIINGYAKQYGPGVWADDRAYRYAIRELYGEPPAKEPETPPEPPSVPAPAAVAPAAEIPNPPGSKRPAPVAAPPTTRHATALSREEEDGRRRIAEMLQERGMKVDADRFVARGTQSRKGASRA